MYKIIITMLLLVSSLIGNELSWAKDFESGIARATKEKKPVLFIYSRHSCKYCVILEETTLSDKRVVKELNENFVSIISYSDENDYLPRELWRPGTPTIWFLKSDGEPMYQPMMGAVKEKQFLKALDIVKEEFNKNKKSGK